MQRDWTQPWTVKCVACGKSYQVAGLVTSPVCDDCYYKGCKLIKVKVSLNEPEELVMFVRPDDDKAILHHICEAIKHYQLFPIESIAEIKTEADCPESWDKWDTEVYGVRTDDYPDTVESLLENPNPRPLP